MPRKRVSADGHFEPAKDHIAHRHFINDGIEPLDQQNLHIRRVAANLDRPFLGNLGIGHNASERARCLLKGLGRGFPLTPDADIGSMRKVLPSRGRHICLIRHQIRRLTAFSETEKVDL